MSVVTIGFGSGGASAGGPESTIGLGLDAECDGLTMALRLAPMSRFGGHARASQQSQTGRQVSVEGAEGSCPAEQGGETLDSEADAK
jgi:hypothetical protein